MVHEIFTSLDTFVGKCYEDLSKNVDCVLKTIREENYSVGEFRKNIAKLAKYKDVLKHMKDAMEFNSDKHIKIINEIEKEIDDRNIGRGLYYMLDEINDALIKTPPRCNLASSRIFLIIHLLKVGYNVIPVFTKNDIIKRLNIYIELYNTKVPYKQYHGRVIQLQPYSSFISDVALIINWECKKCNKIWIDHMSASFDVITPICKFCNSPNVDMKNEEHIIPKKHFLSNFFLKKFRCNT